MFTTLDKRYRAPMPSRHPSTEATDAAIQRRLDALRQIPAKVEAADYMARKFKEAGRPLSEELDIEAWAAGERPVTAPQRPSGADVKIEPGEGRRGFLFGVVLTAAALVALWWLGVF